MTIKTNKAVLILVGILILLIGAGCGKSVPPSPVANTPVASTVAPSATPALSLGLLKGADDGSPLAPKVIGQNPDSQEEARLDAPIELYFDQAMDPATTAQALLVTGPDGKQVTGKITWPQPRVLRFTPASRFQPAATYLASLQVKAKSASGRTLSEPLILKFQTMGDLAISQVSPADGSQEVDSKAIITVIFNHPVVPLVVGNDQGKLPEPLVITPTITGRGEWVNTSVYVFRPDPPLLGSRTYQVEVKAGLEDVSGMKLGERYRWQFSTTSPSIDMLNLPGLFSAPPEGYTNVPLDQSFVITFRQPMDRPSTENAFSLTAPNGEKTPGTFLWSNLSDSLTFTPTQRLELGAAYTLNLDPSAQAETGGGLREGLTWHFTTVLPPAILSTNPYNGETQTIFDAQLGINFASPMKQSSLKDKVTITPKPKGEAQWMYADWGMYFYGLEPSTSYTVQALPGMTDIYGNAIQSTYTFNFRTAPLSPEAYLLMPYNPAVYRVNGPQDFYVNYANVKKLDFELFHFSARSLTSRLGQGQAWNDFEPSASDSILKWSETTTSTVNQRIRRSINLAERLGKPLTPGIYYLTLDIKEIPHETRVLDARIFVVSTTNLTFKITTSEALLWATDIESGAPVPQIPIKVYDPYFNLIGQGITDAKGLSHVSLPVPKENPVENRFAIVDDAGGTGAFAFAASSWDNALPLDDFGIGADYYLLPNNPTAYIYTDRPLYRPGQTVYFKGIVRLNDDLKYSLPPQNQVKITIGSFEQVIYTDTLPLSDSGNFEGKLVLDNNAALGSYYINAQSPNQEMIFGGVSFSVAEYRKPEFQLTVEASQADVQAGDHFRVKINAQFYSGGAVANAPVNWVLTMSPYSFYPAGDIGNQGYNFVDFDQDASYFQPPEEYTSKIVAQGKGATDQNGDLVLDLPADLSDAKGSQVLTLEATVADLTGNQVSERVNVTAHRSAYYPGIKPDRYLGIAGEQQSFSIVVLDWKSKPVANQAVNVDIVERRWYSVQQDDAQGRPHWVSTVEDRPVTSIFNIQTDSSGKASASFTPNTGGVYRAQVTVKDARGSEARSSAYLWVAGSEYIPWRQSNNRTFQLVADRESYLPGDTAEILIASPFQGKTYALVTVERGHVLSQDVIQLENNSTIYKLPINADMAPNAYVSVVIVKGVEQKDGQTIPPAFKYGLKEIKVGVRDQTLKVELTPDRSQVGPGEQVNYTIKTTDFQGQPVKSEVSLALVDLAVLSLTGPNTQPMIDVFYPHRFLSVLTSMELDWSIEDFNAQLQNQVPEGGGAGSGGKGGGASGVFEVRGRFLDTAFWQARILTDENGLAQVSITLPDNLTTWRLDARAITLDTRAGQATVDIVATKPLLVRPQTPRFFVANDEAWLSAAVHNNTKEDLQVQVSLNAKGVTLIDLDTKSINIPAGNQAVVGWNVTVNADAQRVDLIFSASGGSYTDASRPTLGTLDGQGIPVLHYEVPETVATAGSLDTAGSRVESISLPVFPDFNPDQATLTVDVAPSLAAGMTDGLKYLESNPYECIEQTVSRFLPNVITTRALKSAGLSDPNLEENLKQEVNTALQRLYNQQQPDGGWGWWPEDKSDPQVTAYAVLGMIEAQAAGYPVNQGTIDRAVKFLNGSLENLRSLDQPYLLNRQAFVLYVLSRAGRPDVSQEVHLYSIRQSLSLYGRAFLAQSLSLMNPSDERLKTLISDLVSSAALSATGAHWNEDQQDYWNWNTDTRTTAIILDALIKLDPKNSLNENAVRWLMSNRTDGRWEGTQDTAWSLMALTDWMVTSGELQANYSYEVGLNDQSLGGEQVGPENLRKTQELSVDINKLLVDQVNRLVVARTEGSGSLYYTAHLTVSQPVDQVKSLSRGVIVSRSYFRPEDLQTPVTEAALGEILLAKITIVAPSDLHYLVADDPLPAGLEAVDETLKTSQQYTGKASLGLRSTDLEDGWGWWYFNHVELRDEKVVLSVSYLPAGTYEYTYRVRASTPGSFRVIPTTANEFYFPEVYGRGEGSLFVIKP